MILKFLNSRGFREAFIIVLLMVSVFIASTGGIQNMQWSKLLEGVSVSILSAVISIYFLQNIDEKKAIGTAELLRMLQEQGGAIDNAHFVHVGRNMDMGHDYWVHLLDDLDTSPLPVYLVGTKLSWWLRTHVYRDPLRAKLLARLKLAGRREDAAENASYLTYIFMNDQTWGANWSAFVNEIIEEACSKEDPRKRSKMRCLYQSKILIALLPPEMSKYSLYLCGDRFTVIMYSISGRSEDSPTLELRKGSVVRQLFMDDLAIIKAKVQPINQSDSKTEQ